VPERVENTILINGGNRGQYLSVLELTLDGEKAIVDYNGESRPLGDLVAIDPGFNAVITEFNKKYEAMKPKKEPAPEEN
jgi:2',3'-cyclic-nucleotide 2'-phosphodiesterase (5'-nucleotidase family)